MVNIIVAVAKNGVIGGDNSLLWHISEDLQYFKRVTSGHPVIMGRKTWESIGRPLPNRRNVVISRSALQLEGCDVVASIEEALELCDAKSQEVFVIGGAQIYAQTLSIADRIYITRVHKDYEGDTLFPQWDQQGWVLTQSEHHECGKSYPDAFTFELYERSK